MRITMAVYAALLVLPSDAAASPTRGLLPRPGEFHRSGLALGVAVGPTTVFETGDLVDVNGVGAGPSFRVGTKATDSLQWWLQLDGAGFLFRTVEDEVISNQAGLLTIAGQLYLQRALWLKVGLGLGSYRQRIRRQAKLDPPDNFSGPAALAGVGFDLVQRGSLALALELGVAAVRFDEGTLFWLSSGVALHAF